MSIPVEVWIANKKRANVLRASRVSRGGGWLFDSDRRVTFGKVPARLRMSDGSWQSVQLRSPAGCPDTHYDARPT